MSAEDMPVVMVELGRMPFVLLLDEESRMTLSSNGAVNHRMAAGLLGRLALQMEADANRLGDPPVSDSWRKWLDLRWVSEGRTYPDAAAD